MCIVVCAVLVFMTLPLVVGSLDNPSTCALPFPNLEDYYQDGELIIGGVITVNMMMMTFKPDFRTVPHGFNALCLAINLNGYQNLLAFVFAIEEVNKDPDLLRNFTLGFHIVESCLNEERAMIGMTTIISGSKNAVPNYRCNFMHKLVAVVDGISSRVSLLLARFFGIYKIPQIKYATLDPILSDKIKFPTSYRTVPNEFVQYQAIIKLVRHFGWSWVGILVSENESGLKFGQFLQQELTRNGSCVAFLEFIPLRDNTDEKRRTKIAKSLTTSTANINKYLKNIQFKNNAGENVNVDKNGDINSDLDILNWIVYPNGTLDGIHVGKYQQSLGQELSINGSIIRWSPTFTKTPQSNCSERCLPGQRKSIRRGEPVCCYDCIPCLDGEIAAEIDMDYCVKCPDDQWHNANRDTCIYKVITYLSYGEPLGQSLVFGSVLLFVLACLIMAVFIKHRETLVVKANNRDLSYMLLISLKLCFLCTLIFIGHPLRVTCILRQTVFGVTFSVSVSSILAKTVTVVLAFKATKPGNIYKKWMGPRLSNLIVFVSSLTQVVICVLWLGISPPFPYYNMEDEVGKIVAECNEGSPVGFYSLLLFMGFLSLVSFIIAFLARKLPDVYNEARLIVFSMLLFLSVWISFIPAYLSTKGKYVVAVEIFAILASSAGLLGCIFIPKCYIILMKPEHYAKISVTNKSKM
ncbi:vomeronasal type-2 receptor 26-like [Pelodytes ibericus]